MARLKVGLRISCETVSMQSVRCGWCPKMLDVLLRLPMPGACQYYISILVGDWQTSKSANHGAMMICCVWFHIQQRLCKSAAVVAQRECGDMRWRLGEE